MEKELQEELNTIRNGVRELHARVRLKSEENLALKRKIGHLHEELKSKDKVISQLDTRIRELGLTERERVLKSLAGEPSGILIKDANDNNLMILSHSAFLKYKELYYKKLEIECCSWLTTPGILIFYTFIVSVTVFFLTTLFFHHCF